MEWTPLEPPLPPVAVLARGEVVPALLAALRARLDAGAELLVTRADGVVLVLGEADELPWADGVVHLGESDRVLHPTTRRPACPLDLLRRRLGAGLADDALLVVLQDAVLAGPRPRRPPGRDDLRAVS